MDDSCAHLVKNSCWSYTTSPRSFSGIHTVTAFIFLIRHFEKFSVEMCRMMLARIAIMLLFKTVESELNESAWNDAYGRLYCRGLIRLLRVLICERLATKI